MELVNYYSSKSEIWKFNFLILTQGKIDSKVFNLCLKANEKYIFTYKQHHQLCENLKVPTPVSQLPPDDKIKAISKKNSYPATEPCICHNNAGNNQIKRYGRFINHYMKL